MTYKQLRILQTALELFAKEGYQATTTQKIAKQARVSEGLLFKHFGNKAGLLDAIIKEGEKRIQTLYEEIVNEPDSKKALRMFIESPFSIKLSEYDFWKLQFKLKWELNIVNNENIGPVQKRLEEAFTELKYNNPKLETEYLFHMLEGITGALLKNSISDKTQLKLFLLEKYNLRNPDE